VSRLGEIPVETFTEEMKSTLLSAPRPPTLTRHVRDRADGCGAGAVSRISWTQFDLETNHSARTHVADARRDAGVQIRSSSGQPPRNSGPSGTAEVTLPAVTDSVRAARRFVSGALMDLDATGACDDAVTLVSELATNAVIHARTPYKIVVSRDGDTVRVGVHDLSAVVPRRRAYGLDATTGRGLRLIATISSDWGIDAETGGKVVWFELPCDGGPEVAAWYADVDVDALLDAFDDDQSGASRSQVQR
jgi:anti-sigma regulatory factor (Ser/Thr protein kinase)